MADQGPTTGDLSFDTQDGDLMGYASFELDGHRFEAWQPANSRAEREFVLRVFKGDELVRTETVQMFYPNIFGVDIGDKVALERVTDEVIGELGLDG